MSNRLAVLAASCALLFSSATLATPAGAGPEVRIDTANLILANLGVAPEPRAMSRPLQPVAQSCKDKCEDDRDKCFNGCPSEPNEAAVCRNDCSDTYDGCLKGC